MKITLDTTRIAFCNVHEAKAFQGDGEPRFSATFIIEPGSPNAKALASGMAQVATEKWGPKGAATLADLVKKGRVCYSTAPKTNASGEVYDGFEDMHSVTASNKVRPTVIDRDTSPLVAADGRPYSGCYVNAIIELWAQDNQFGKRINATLKGVQFVRNGDAFAGGASVARADEFADLGVDESAESLV